MKIVMCRRIKHIRINWKFRKYSLTLSDQSGTGRNNHISVVAELVKLLSILSWNRKWMEGIFSLE